MADAPKDLPDLIEQIPDPDTVRRLLADSVRRADLLRSLLRLARRKAAYPTAAAQSRSSRSDGLSGTRPRRSGPGSRRNNVGVFDDREHLAPCLPGQSLSR